MTYEQIIALADQLPRTDKARLIAYLAETLYQEQDAEGPRGIAWSDFIDQMAGSLTLTPIQRWDEGDAEVREPLE